MTLTQKDFLMTKVLHAVKVFGHLEAEIHFVQAVFWPENQFILSLLFSSVDMMLRWILTSLIKSFHVLMTLRQGLEQWRQCMEKMSNWL